MTKALPTPYQRELIRYGELFIELGYLLVLAETTDAERRTIGDAMHVPADWYTQAGYVGADHRPELSRLIAEFFAEPKAAAA